MISSKCDGDNKGDGGGGGDDDNCDNDDDGNIYDDIERGGV